MALFLERTIVFRVAAPWSMNETFSLQYISYSTTKGCPNVAATGENFHLVQTRLENQQVSRTPLTKGVVKKLAFMLPNVHHLLRYAGWNATAFPSIPADCRPYYDGEPSANPDA